MRTCVGCRRVLPAVGMIRVVVAGSGDPAPSIASSGRGAWLCKGSARCFEAASRRGALTRALRAPVSDVALERLAVTLGLSTSRNLDGDPVAGAKR